MLLALLVKLPRPEVPAPQAPLGASLWSATAPAQLDSRLLGHPDSQLEEELQAEALVAAREIARAKPAQARVSIGR